MNITVEKFGGVAPRIEAHNLPAHLAVTAKNCFVGDGEIRPAKGATAVGASTIAGILKSIYRYGTGHWFSFPKDTNVVRLPIAEDTIEKTLIITNDGTVTPKITTSEIATSGGGTGYPTVTLPLGVPAPANAVIAGAVGPVPEVTDITEDRFYVITYVNAWGWEGPPSPISPLLNVGPAQTVGLSNLGTTVTGGYNLTHKRIYRTAAGNSTAEFRFVAEILVGIDTYSDTVATTALGEVLSTADYALPPADLSGVVLLPCNVMVGWSGRSLCFSEPGQFFAWPVRYRKSMPYVPNGIGVFGTSFVVLGAGLPEVFTGDHPDNFNREKIENGAPCLTGRGIVDLGYAIAYPGPEGLMLVGVGVNKNLTEKLLTVDQWKALTPETFTSGYFGKTYVGFPASGDAMIFDPASGELTFMALAAAAIFLDRTAGKMFVLQDHDIMDWGTGAAIAYTWRSKPFIVVNPTSFRAIAVKANSYPVTVKVLTTDLSGTVHEQSVTVSNARATRLPGKGWLADSLAIEITGTGTPYRVSVATNNLSLKQS